MVSNSNPEIWTSTSAVLQHNTGNILNPEKKPYTIWFQEHQQNHSCINTENNLICFEINIWHTKHIQWKRVTLNYKWRYLLTHWEKPLIFPISYHEIYHSCWFKHSTKQIWIPVLSFTGTGMDNLLQWSNLKISRDQLNRCIKERANEVLFP